MDMNEGEGMLVGEEYVGWRGIQRRKKWDNYNSIINKIYFFKKRNPGENKML